MLNVELAKVNMVMLYKLQLINIELNINTNANRTQNKEMDPKL